MSLLRSTLFIAIMSAFLLAGYGVDLLGDCCAHEEVKQVECSSSVPMGSVPAKGEGCQCVCHQTILPGLVEPARIAEALSVVTDAPTAPDEIPPDAVPLGIEYPPQLA